MGEFADRRKKARSVGPAARAGKDAEFEKEFPCLWDMLSSTAYKDKSPRKTSTVLIFRDEGVWKCCLSDRDLGEVAFVTSETVMGLLQQLEEGLAADRLDWRRSHTPGGRGKRS